MKQNKRMPKWFIILILIIGVMAILFMMVILTSLSVARATTGETITQYDNPKSALLVIDIQNDTTSNSAFYGNTTEFIESVNQAVTFAEDNDMEILYVKNITGSNPIIQLLSQGKYKKGTKGAELDANLRLVNDNVFEKSIGDSFSSNEFEDYLLAKKIDTLYIVGADAAACVYSTSVGGLNRSYNVNIIKEAIITVNDKTLNQMLEQYEKDGIGVISIMQFQELAQNN